MVKRQNNSGFTLIEVVAVIGVLAVTSAVLIVNNRLNELQLSLNTDIAGVTNAVSRAKALTLQGVGADKGICGYGVSFGQGLNNAPDTYTINSYTNCADLSGKAILTDQGGANNLSSGLRLVTITSSDKNYFVKDLLFYSSDARVKLINVNGDPITAGVVIIATESMPTSFMTLKITATGQVTSRAGAYVTPYYFDNGIESNLTRGAGGAFTGAEDTKPGTGTIGDEEGEGLADEGIIPGNPCVPTSCAGKTCADFNGCGSPCATCLSGQLCVNKDNLYQCIQCPAGTPTCVNPDGSNKSCGEDDGCFGFCTSCTYCPDAEECSVTIGLIIYSIDPPIGVK